MSLNLLKATALDPETIKLIFDKPLDPTPATDPANYVG